MAIGLVGGGSGSQSIRGQSERIRLLISVLAYYNTTIYVYQFFKYYEIP